MTGIPEESDLRVLTERLRAFAEARKWERFHTPKNLAMSVAIEAAELMEPMHGGGGAGECGVGAKLGDP